MTEPSLDIITRDFGLTYSAAKTTAKDLEKQKYRLFAAIDKVIARGLLAQQIVAYPEELPEDTALSDWVRVWYPGWRMADSKYEKGKILIEEDPSLAKFRYVNKADGYVYGRTVVNSGQSLDDERLQEEDPDLWETITQWPEPWYEIAISTLGLVKPDMSRTARELTVSDSFERHGIERILISPSDWTEETHEKVNKYLVPGPLTLRVEAPRKAKPEELEEAS